MKYEDRDDVEFADLRKRRLSPAQRRRIADAWKRAAADGKRKGPPMTLSTAQILLSAITE